MFFEKIRLHIIQCDNQVQEDIVINDLKQAKNRIEKNMEHIVTFFTAGEDKPTVGEFYKIKITDFIDSSLVGEII